jgi:hypothetical protein
MPYTKYLGSRPCESLEEAFKNILIILQVIIFWNNSGSPSPKKQTSQV